MYLYRSPNLSFAGINMAKPKIAGFSFCGNAGRFQRIPLILDAIEKDFGRGGSLEFSFAGGGVYADQLKAFSKEFSSFHYAGLVSSTEAAQINSDYTWALLPIDDEVTQFAFPSKSSSYVFSGANILAVCNEHTSVSKWVKENQVGIVVRPNINDIVAVFFDIEKGLISSFNSELLRRSLKDKLKFEVFIDGLEKIVLN